jgi:hypothetical protein
MTFLSGGETVRHERRQRPRDDERQELEARWEENCKRRKAGWPPIPADLELFGDNTARHTTHTFDAQGEPVTKELRGMDAWKNARVMDQYSATLREKVARWINRKEISGEDVMEVLGLALALTNHPAYDAARKAMHLHRLDTGGLKRAFRKLQRRHNPLPEDSCADCVTWYIDEFGYGLRRAVEHVVADLGIPGTSFADAVDKVRKAYRKHEQHAAERQR